VEFGLAVSGQHPAAFVLSDRRLITDPPKKIELTGPKTSGRGMTVAHWEDEHTPTLNGVALKLDKYEISRAAAVSHDHLLLGTDWSLRLFNKAGPEVWYIATPGTTWAVNLTSDGRLAVAAFGDGTIRWFRMKDGEELLALFPDADGKTLGCM